MVAQQTEVQPPGAGELAAPTMSDVLRARRRIRPYLRATPLFEHPGLRALVGTDVWVKHENHQPIGAFKVRGGVNLVSQLDDDERAAGLIAASTGNHGQSIAYAGRLFGVAVVVCVPEGANPVKVSAMRALGAQVVETGRDFDDAREHCERLAAERGYRYVHAANEPLLVSGVATATLEILEDQPDLDVVIVPVGGGSAAAGACVVRGSCAPSMRVIGVQSGAAPAAHHSWQQGRLVQEPMGTFAEGLATGSAFELPQQILRDHLDDFVLVSDDEIRRAMVLMIEHTHNLVEAAGAAALAGALKLAGELAGKRVGLMCSGGNVSVGQLDELLAWSG